MKKVINTNLAPKAIGPYSQAIVVNDLMFTSGQLPINPDNGELVKGIEVQIQQAMENIKNILAAEGMGLSNIVKTTIFLTDLNNFDIVNNLYGSYFKQDPPARSCFEVSKLPKGALIEIEVVACK
jgi:2-iminobutanoate/2-iminopropanoate deaminase